MEGSALKASGTCASSLPQRVDVFLTFFGYGDANFPPIHGLILNPFASDGCALSHLRRRPMIRTIALTLISLAGLGAIAGAAIRSTPPLPEIVRPVVAGNKADRLPLVANEDPLKAAEKIDTAYVQPVGEVQSSPPAETPPVATPAASDPKPSKVDAPRRAKATTASRQNVSRSKRVAAADRSPKEVSAPAAATPDSASPSNQTSALKECSSSGLDPLLRKLNLAPPCS